MGIQGEFFDAPRSEEPESAEEASAQPSGKRGLKDLSIPKLYYSISEVSRLTGLEQYVLRYWETEFEDLRPQKNRAGNRIYSNKDIKFILRIRELLREKRYTIEGAKQILKDGEKKGAAKGEAPEGVTEGSAEPSSEKSAAQQEQSGSLSVKDIQEMKAALEALKAAFTKKS